MSDYSDAFLNNISINHQHSTVMFGSFIYYGKTAGLYYIIWIKHYGWNGFRF